MRGSFLDEHGRARKNVDDDIFDVCCYFFPQFQFSIRGKKNEKENMAEILCRNSLEDAR